MEVAQKKDVNYCLNFLKGIACFGVVYLHTCYGSKITPIFVCIFRFAVPLFFVISGYYCIKNRDNAKQTIIKKIKRTLKICVVYEIVYFVFNAVVYPFLNGEKINIIAYCNKTFTMKSLLRFIFLNQSFDSGILWFIYALLYCYIAMLIVYRLKSYRVIYAMGVIFLIGHIVLRSLIVRFTTIPEEVNELWFRNFFFIGIPFFAMGLFIKEYENSIKQKLSSNKIILLIIVAGELLSFVERYFFPLEIFVGTTVVVFMLFVFTLNNSQKMIWKPMCIVGSKYYMNEYFWHVIVRSLLLLLLSKLSISILAIDVFRPIIVFVIIIIVTFIVRTTKKTLTRSFKQFSR